jgi:hypothetical protein
MSNKHGRREEVVPLAAGMLAAGYRSVVATMWSINESYGPHVAREFYRDIILHNDMLLGKTGLRLNEPVPLMPSTMPPNGRRHRDGIFYMSTIPFHFGM